MHRTNDSRLQAAQTPHTLKFRQLSTVRDRSKARPIDAPLFELEQREVSVVDWFRVLQNQVETFLYCCFLINVFIRLRPPLPATLADLSKLRLLNHMFSRSALGAERGWPRQNLPRGIAGTILKTGLFRPERAVRGGTGMAPAKFTTRVRARTCRTGRNSDGRGKIYHMGRAGRAVRGGATRMAPARFNTWVGPDMPYGVQLGWPRQDLPHGSRPDVPSGVQPRWPRYNLPHGIAGAMEVPTRIPQIINKVQKQPSTEPQVVPETCFGTLW